MGDIIVDVTNKNNNLDLPRRILSPGTQRNFNEAIKKGFTKSYEPWTANRKPIDTAREFQKDIISASNKSSPLYLTTAHQKTQ